MSASLCRLVAPVLRQSCQLQLDRSPVPSTLRANYVVACEVNEREFKGGLTCCFGKVKWLKNEPLLFYTLTLTNYWQLDLFENHHNIWFFKYGYIFLKRNIVPKGTRDIFISFNLLLYIFGIQYYPF